MMAEIMKDSDNMTEAKRNRMKEFLPAFYTTCGCKEKACHFKVCFKQAFETFDDYRNMTKNEARLSLGALVKNMQIPGKTGKRNVGLKFSYEFRIEDVIVCKDFFAMVHNTSIRKIELLTDCIKKEKPFKHLRGGNHVISEELKTTMREGSLEITLQMLYCQSQKMANIHYRPQCFC